MDMYRSLLETKVVAYLPPGLSFRLMHQRYPVLLYAVVKDRFYEKIKDPLISHDIFEAFLNPISEIFSVLFPEPINLLRIFKK